MKIVGLGDSITWGYPYGPTDSWLTIVGEKLGYQYVNMGINGETTEEMLLRVPQVMAERPDVVILLGGTNDAYQGIALQNIQQNVTAIFTQITEGEEHNTVLVLGLPTPVQEADAEAVLLAYRKWLKIFARENRLPIIDFYTALHNPQTGNLQGEYDTDGCHPSRIGHEKMAETAIDFFKVQLMVTFSYPNTF